MTIAPDTCIVINPQLVRVDYWGDNHLWNVYFCQKTSAQAWEHSNLGFVVFNISFSIYSRTHSASHCIGTILKIAIECIWPYDTIVACRKEPSKTQQQKTRRAHCEWHFFKYPKMDPQIYKMKSLLYVCYPNIKRQKWRKSNKWLMNEVPKSKFPKIGKKSG